jgi:hypothetical protein
MLETPTIPIKKPTHSAPDWLGAVYLAVSWTWCIGIFLPVILVRDFGWAGWIVFAIPNIVGAAAFGWFVRDRDHVDRLLAAHQPVFVAFSLVTIAFQVFFVTWFFGRLNMLAAMVACLILAGTVRVLGERRRGLDALAAATGFFLSLVILVWWIVHLLGTPAASTVEPAPWTDFSRHVFIRPGFGVIGLSTVCIFGFALCPYFDLTFYAARRDMPAGSAHRAFGWGFGFFFLLMILLSLAYAPTVAAAMAGHTASPLVMRLVAIHIVVQIALTIAFHARATLDRLSDRRGPMVLGSTVGAGILIGAVALAIGPVFGLTAGGSTALTAGELVYRLFMSFYGLIFPAYAWICMLANFRNPSPPSSARIRVTVVAIAIAAPMFAMGFIAGHTIWLIPGIAVVLLSPLTTWRKVPHRPIMPPTAN